MSPFRAAGPETQASASRGCRRMLLGLVAAGAVVWVAPLCGVDSLLTTPATAGRLVQLLLMAASTGGMLAGITGLLRWRAGDGREERAAALLLCLIGLVATTRLLASALHSSGGEVVAVGLFLGALVSFLAVIGGLTTTESNDGSGPLLLGIAVALSFLAAPTLAPIALGGNWTAGALPGRALLVLGGLGALTAVLVMVRCSRPESRADLLPAVGMVVLLVELRLGQAALGGRSGGAELSAGLLLVAVAFGGIALQAKFGAVVKQQRQLLSSALESLTTIEDRRAVEVASVTDLRHDLRAALFAMASGLEALVHPGSSAGDPEFESLTCALHREATRLMGMLDRERDPAGDVAGETPACDQRGPAVEVEVMETLSSVVLCARAGGLAIELYPSWAPCPVPPTVAETAARVLTTLLDNARHYGKAPVEVVVVAEDSLSVRVTDSGPGVPEHLLAAIFQPGFRGPGRERVAGSGLGLAIGRQLARGLGGDLVAASAPSGGLSVELVLPIARFACLSSSWHDGAHDLRPDDSAGKSEMSRPREIAPRLTEGRHRRAARKDPERQVASLRGLSSGQGEESNPLGRDPWVIAGESGVALREDQERAGQQLSARSAVS